MFFIIYFKSKLVARIRRLYQEWGQVANKRGEVTFLLVYLVIDLLNLVGCNSRPDFEAVFGAQEGAELWKKETA
ncbi:hypothetical protein SDC9_156274 [bioreactor metagenome]|uniref:Uncharacterized protein n=1 Tax=bioreactor metagenome TaxID=1076179 RepID=A0A645F5T0_9ZZZZ